MNINEWVMKALIKLGYADVGERESRISYLDAGEERSREV